jgi:hypothetical protein
MYYYPRNEAGNMIISCHCVHPSATFQPLNQITAYEETCYGCSCTEIVESFTSQFSTISDANIRDELGTN